MIRILFWLTIGFFLGFKAYEQLASGRCAGQDGEWDGYVCQVSGTTE